MNYYNENDPKAAAWLAELIKAGEIPGGWIDTRDIRLVRPGDLRGFIQCHFFAGIGGWPLALRLARWPQDRPVWTGSCPCQPFSCAGKGLGKRDPRHLWPEFFRLIRQRRPAIVLGEQVASKAGRGWLAGVFADLETLAYAGAGADLCAAGVGAPHIRQRLWWVADYSRKRWLRRANSTEPSRRALAKIGVATRGLDNQRGQRRRTLGNHHREDVRLLPSANGQIVRLGDTGYIPGRETEGQLSPEQQGQKPLSGTASQDPRLGDADAAGRREQCGPGPVAAEFTAVECSGAWSRFDVIPCLDGKSRRVESGTFPLAHGVPGRVGLLRGYGNAIVPQLAAEFIRAIRD